MYSYLKLFNLKGLKECYLSELGQINIICGKNNSGKSTLLEAILKPENKFLGMSLTETETAQIYKNSYRNHG
jgi:AAA15 family ATPase/GTPase